MGESALVRHHAPLAEPFQGCSHAASIPTGPSLGIAQSQTARTLYEQKCSSGGSAGAVLRTPRVDAVVGTTVTRPLHGATVTRPLHDALGVHGPRQPAGRLARPPAEFESFSLRRLWQTRRFALVIGRLTLTIEKSAEESGQSSVSGDTGYRRWTNVDGERACTWALVGTAEALAGRTESRGLRPRLDEEAFWRRGGQGQVRQRGRQRGQQRQQRQVSGWATGWWA